MEVAEEKKQTLGSRDRLLRNQGTRNHEIARLDYALKE